MTRQEQLKYCKTCQNRGFNTRKGIICGLTGDIAGFDVHCPHYQIDERAQSLERYIKENAPLPKPVKMKKQKTKQSAKLSRNETVVLIGLALLAAFVFRLSIYIKYSYESKNITSFLCVVLFVFTALAFLLRKKAFKTFSITSSLMYNLLFAAFFSLINLIYMLLVYPFFYKMLLLPFLIVILSFALGVLSYIIVIPPGILLSKWFSKK
ncbi:MAG: hypothetical protein JXB34_06225 [Bacteroidales bacterium]|nr:hypothetical protein [Bacteroidales bacterium]